tara:strand:+ start:302 stop:532 length:231 start_codon:yes stop_codon:yes gene_type:complete
MLEYIAGPIVAVLISLKYTKYMSDKQSAKCEACCAQIESVEKKLEIHDKEVLQKVMTTVLPVAKAVNRLNNEVGIR